MKYVTALTFIFLFSHFAVAQQPGEIDLSFANSGRSVIDIDVWDECTSIACDDLGNTYFAGYSGTFVPATDFDYIIGKLDSMGNLDPAFGVNGIVRGDFPNYAISRIVDLELDTNGIYFLGSAGDFGVADTQDFYVGKVLLDGTLDVSFGNMNGYYNGNYLGTYDVPGAIELLPNRNLLICGASHDTLNGLREMPLIGRLLPNGLPDSTFGTTGFIVWDDILGLNDVQNFQAGNSRHNGGGYLYDVEVLDNGDYFFSGHLFPGTFSSCLTLMISSDGDLVPSYGAGGAFVFDAIPGYNNRIVKSAWYNNQMMLGVVVEDFQIPKNFVLQPISITGVLGTVQSFDFASNADEIKDMTVGQNGNLLFAGYSRLLQNTSAGYDSDLFAVLALDSNALPSVDFASNGYFTEDFNTNDECGATAICISTNRKLMLGGYVNNIDSVNLTDFAFMRLHNNEPITGIENITDNELLLYPNPTTGIVKLSERVKGYQLYNYNGQLLKESNIRTNSIDLTELPSALYFIKTGTISLTVIKQ
jgi:uncharacterized delta-60 repeat protein